MKLLKCIMFLAGLVSMNNSESMENKKRKYDEACLESSVNKEPMITFELFDSKNQVKKRTFSIKQSVLKSFTTFFTHHQFLSQILPDQPLLLDDKIYNQELFLLLPSLMKLVAECETREYAKEKLVNELTLIKNKNLILVAKFAEAGGCPLLTQLSRLEIVRRAKESTVKKKLGLIEIV